MKILNSYINGNHKVIIFDDGTKIKETGSFVTSDPKSNKDDTANMTQRLKWVSNDDDHFTYDFPENFDIKITDQCDGGCIYCFPANTPVLLNNGNTKNICDIKIGDIVKSYNMNTNKIENNIVDKLYNRQINEKLYVFTLENGKVFKCTGNHPIYTKNGKKRADEITLNDEILDITQFT